MPQFLVMSLLLMLSGFTAQAGFFPDLKNNKLRPFVCETMLLSGVRDSSEQSDIRPALSDLRSILTSNSPMSNNDGAFYLKKRYIGPLDKLKPQDAAEIIARINAIQEDIQGKNLDVQVVTMEFRGEAAIQEALQKIETKEKELDAIYKKTIDGIYTKAEQNADLKILRDLHIGYAASMILPAYALGNPLHIAGMMAFSATTFSAWTYFGYYRRWLKEVDARYELAWKDLKNRLKQTVQNPSSLKGQLFANSNAVFLSPEFHSAVMSDGKSYSMDQIREEALRYYGLRYPTQLAIGWSDRKHEDRPPNAEPPPKVHFMDQFVYFDERTQEPVWLFFYRAHAVFPSMRAPTRKQEVKEKKSVWEGIGLPAPAR